MLLVGCTFELKIVKIAAHAIWYNIRLVSYLIELLSIGSIEPITKVFIFSPPKILEYNAKLHIGRTYYWNRMGWCTDLKTYFHSK